jgi:hypothetical protein
MEPNEVAEGGGEKGSCLKQAAVFWPPRFQTQSPKFNFVGGML